ncbi:hypothetical protein ABT147_35215 [Streptomyces sp. NPDC001868]|uniref:hypothetical protein n=1 Tax=Streptomyces sp. NPDC001868 TaxID=3154401 RepID=UPI00332D8074
MVALKPHRGTRDPTNQPHTPVDTAHTLTWRDAKRPGDWTPVERHFRDGDTETWWAADARLGGYGPDSPHQPAPPLRSPHPHPPADLAEIVRLYGLPPWIEQSNKQIDDELGWADSRRSA